MKSDQRIEWVDVLKCICIFFVIASHVGNLSIAPLLRQFYTPFFLSGFFLASGYTYRHRTGFAWHLRKKVYQLLIPWFFFSMLTRILAQLRSFGLAKFLDDMKWNFLQIRGLDDGMWFVAALFVAFIPFYYLIDRYEKTKEKHKGDKQQEAIRRRYLCISVVLMLLYCCYSTFVPAVLFPWGRNALPWHIEYIPFALGCMFIGYSIKEQYEGVLDAVCFRTSRLVILTVLYLSIIYIPVFLNVELTGLIRCCYDSILSLLGMFFVCCIAKRLPANRFLLFAGQNTLVYFGLQGKCIFVIETLLKKMDADLFSWICSHWIYSILYSLAVAAVLSILLVIPAIIFNRYLPFLVGRRRTEHAVKEGRER